MRRTARLLFLLSIAISFFLTSQLVSAQVLSDCVVDDDEPHPLRPYPGIICGPEADRTIDQTDLPYCAWRPWATRPIQYMKNMEDCELVTLGDGTDLADQYPCIIREFDGDFTINLQGAPGNEYELPLVSVTRNGSDLTYFNRAQQHLADYIEGRAYYEGVVEPSWNSITDRTEIWNRLGVLRKLLPVSLQDARKIANIERANSEELHDYIVSYVQNDQPVDWQTSGASIIRMTNFTPSRQPPNLADYDCYSLSDPVAREECIQQFLTDLRDWRTSLYGQLWPNVPMFTREDALGYVQLNPEPDQWFDWPNEEEFASTSAVFIPHLPRLNDVTKLLRNLLESLTRPSSTAINCNIGVVANDACVFDIDSIENLALNWVSGMPGNHVQDCYGDVINRAHSAGVNAQLAMIIWLNESNASNYSLSGQDFGINDPSVEYDFNAQITRFMGLPAAYQAGWSQCYNNPPITTYDPQNACQQTISRPMTNLEIFLAIFKSGNCDTNSGKSYACSIQSRWDWVGTCPIPSSP